jgi:hypothetical protein
LRERQNELKNGSVEDILVKLNSADIPFWFYFDENSC